MQKGTGHHPQIRELIPLEEGSYHLWYPVVAYHSHKGKTLVPDPLRNSLAQSGSVYLYHVYNVLLSSYFI